MTTRIKISPAFDPFLSGSGPRDKLDAIVIYRPPPAYPWPVRGRRRSLKQRLDYVKEVVRSQKPIEEKVLSDYQEEGSRRLAGKHKLAASSIGGATLPVATVEVTRKTLSALAAKPDVVAPGVQVYSSIPPEKRPDGTHEYAYMDGTSMATPHVAGVAALLMSAEPAAPARTIIQALKDTAKHPDGKELRPGNRWGYGLVQPGEALQALK